MNLMTLVSTCARRSAVAPAALRHRADNSCGRKPRVGPNAVTAVWMVLVMEAAVTKVQEL